MNPHIVVLTRSKKRKAASIRKPSEDFAHESKWWFLIELFLFGVLVAASTWPVINAAEALRWL